MVRRDEAGGRHGREDAGCPCRAGGALEKKYRVRESLVVAAVRSISQRLGAKRANKPIMLEFEAAFNEQVRRFDVQGVIEKFCHE